MVESINRQDAKGEIEKKVDKVSGQLEDWKVKPEQVQKELIATAQNLQALPAGGKQALNSFFELIGELLAKLGAAFRQLNGSWALDVQDGDTSSLAEAQQLAGGKPVEPGNKKPGEKPKAPLKPAPKPKEGYAEPVLKAQDFTGLVGLKAVEAGEEGPKLTLDLVGGLKGATAEIIHGKDGKPETAKIQKDGVTVWISLSSTDITGAKLNVLDGINPKDSEKVLAAIIEKINTWMERFYKAMSFNYENGETKRLYLLTDEFINTLDSPTQFENAVPFDSKNYSYNTTNLKPRIEPAELTEESLKNIKKIAENYRLAREEKPAPWEVSLSNYKHDVTNESRKNAVVADKILDWIRKDNFELSLQRKKSIS